MQSPRFNLLHVVAGLAIYQMTTSLPRFKQYNGFGANIDLITNMGGFEGWSMSTEVRKAPKMDGFPFTPSTKTH